MAVFVVKYAVAHSYVYAFICWCPERVSCEFAVWGGEGKPVEIGQF